VTNQGPSAKAAGADGAHDRYYDGRNAVAHPVRVTVAGTRLKIVAAGGRILAEWPLADIETVDQRFGDGTFAYALASGLQQGDGARLILTDSGTRNLLLAMRPELAQWKRQRRHRGLKQAAFWVGLVAVLLVGVYFSLPLIAEEAARAMPRRWETPIGQTMRNAFVSLSPTCHGEPGIVALNILLSRLAPDEIEDPPLTLDVIDDGKTVNAFALPGNHIVVFRGLIDKAGSGDEVAGVLAHELGHLDLRHPMQNAIQQVGLGAVLTMALGGSDVSGVGQLLLGFTYTRRMEAAADARGVELLEAAGLRADGLAGFFRRLGPAEGKGLLPDWLVSHPGLADRIAATDRPANGENAFDDKQWAAVKTVCASTVREPDPVQDSGGDPAASEDSDESVAAPVTNAKSGKPKKSTP
jgi:Zn-dependent protease with chaperone function